jgi:hypothetical protein
LDVVEMKFLYRQKRRGLYAWPNVYYIGTIQGIVDAEMPEGSHIAADLVTSDTPLEDVDEGIYDINVYGRDARLFLWEHLERYEPISIMEYAIPGEVPLKYGMIVDAEDSSTLEEAEELYEAKGTI